MPPKNRLLGTGKYLSRKVESLDSDNSSDESSADEDDTKSDAPQPLPSIEVTVLSHAERRQQKRKATTRTHCYLRNRVNAQKA